LGDLLNSIDSGNLKLRLITNRGVKVYPNGIPETYCTDHWRCRFVSKHNEEINGKVDKLKEILPIDITNLLNSLTSKT
jgi:isocitrate dehydrogenase